MTRTKVTSSFVRVAHASPRTRRKRPHTGLEPIFMHAPYLDDQNGRKTMQDQMLEEIDESIAMLTAKPKTWPNGSPVDVGAENIDIAGGLMGQALREIFEEGAK